MEFEYFRAFMIENVPQISLYPESYGPLLTGEEDNWRCWNSQRVSLPHFSYLSVTTNFYCADKEAYQALTIIPLLRKKFGWRLCLKTCWHVAFIQ